jgi:ribonuclease J
MQSWCWLKTLLTFLHTGNPTGLKFTIEHGDARVMIDCGIEHAPGRMPFAAGLQPRGGREIEDLMAVGAAPSISGVFGEWDRRTSVFISHIHLDHTGLVQYVGPDVPLFYPAEMEPVRVFMVEHGLGRWRDKPGTPTADRTVVAVGDISVQFVAVDHDAPGSTGFLIRTPDISFAFTGDTRWHGLHPELTAAFVDAARGVDVLIQESVTLGFTTEQSTQLSESEAIDEIGRTISACRGLVVINQYPLNFERVLGVARACAANDRLVLTAGEDDLQRAIEHPERACVSMPFSELPSLIDLRPPRGSVYIHSNGPPLGQYDPAWPVMLTWVERFGLEMKRISSTGHSRPEDIKRMVRSVAPGVWLPVHTQAPDVLEVLPIRRLIPTAGRPYSVAELMNA